MCLKIKLILITLEIYKIKLVKIQQQPSASEHATRNAKIIRTFLELRYTRIIFIKIRYKISVNPYHPTGD